MVTTLHSFTSSQQKNNTWFSLILAFMANILEDKENCNNVETLVEKTVHLKELL